MDYSALIAKRRERFSELEEAVGDPALFAEPKRATDPLREHRKLKQTLELWDNLQAAKRHLADNQELAKSDDADFAALLSGSIRNDMQPENAWAIAPRETLPELADFNYTMGKLSEQMPVFDVWPWPYATSYQVRAECGLIDYTAPEFTGCSEAVGDFPEVNMSLKGIYTRIITVFGAGLEPIL